ncbi:hypothetical protein [Haloarcula amylolytica]|uniref:Uncharacterized protein n=1 Tax=Haloarcula amylolytica JCM 13557 TaxID=1227452 RepID=M0K778_9EURY|nr:hypothetical protein [Haloarcula amylolytica]EMA17041.1 hypothetical protein C442_17265 [Haloarcula amylolytica JCM 13557]
MATENCPEPSPEPLYDLAGDLIESGVVTITAVEDILPTDQLMLSLHPALDADDDAIRAIFEGVEQVCVGDRVFTLYCDIDPFGPSTRSRVTVFFDPPGGVVTHFVPPISLEEGIDRLLSIANGGR